MTTWIFAVDPGSAFSAGVLLNAHDFKFSWAAKVTNQELLVLLRKFHGIKAEDAELIVVCEFPYPRGQMASFQTFETCEFAGMLRLTADQLGLKFIKMDRADVKKLLASGVKHPKDKDVRQGLINLYGVTSIQGPKCELCRGKGFLGKKKENRACGQCQGTGKVTPGLLHEVSRDVWQALAVGRTFLATGASKSADVLQVERKERKAEKKLEELEDLKQKKLRFDETLKEEPKTQKQATAREVRLKFLAKRIMILRLRYPDQERDTLWGLLSEPLVSYYPIIPL